MCHEATTSQRMQEMGGIREEQEAGGPSDVRESETRAQKQLALNKCITKMFIQLSPSHLGPIVCCGSVGILCRHVGSVRQHH